MMFLFQTTSRTSPHPVHLVVLGVSDGKRIRGLQAAAKKLHSKIQLDVIEYSHAIHQPDALLNALRPDSWLKIDSPGEDAQVQKEFIQRGWVLQQHTQRPLMLPQVHGELMASDDWFFGFSDFLHDIEKRIPPSLKIRHLNAIKPILLMTDKWRCQQHLQAYNIPIPKLLGRVRNYDAFKTIMQNHDDAPQVFIKPRYGSSASGVIAYRHNRQGQQVAISTAFFEGDKVLNNKRTSRYTQESDIARLINHIGQYDAYIEKWIPKPRLTLGEKDQSFDFRIVTLAGQPQHKIARASMQPMTNLHLDSQRVAPTLVKQHCDIPYMHDIIKESAQSFRGANMIGFDAICTRNKTWVLEANAFGDLLPNLLYNELDTYDAQLAYILKQENTRTSILTCQT